MPQSPPGAPAPIATDEVEEAPAEPAAVSMAGPRQAPVRAAVQAERPMHHRTVLVDYGYVKRDLRRILVLATLVIVAIVVLSFFLP